MANATLADVVSAIEHQTEYTELLDTRFKDFFQELQVQNDQAKLDRAEASSEGGIPAKTLAVLKEIRDQGGMGGGGTPQGEKRESSFGAAFGESFGGLAGTGAGLGALGAGIGAFFAGLALSDAALSMYSGDMSNIKKVVVGTGEIFSELDFNGFVGIGSLLAAGGAMGALLGPGGSLKAGFGMFTLGAGIGAFFTGLAVNDAAIQKYGGSGESIKALMKNVSEGIGSFTSNVDAGAIAVLFGTGALLGQVPGVGGKATIGMGLLGAGIGAFFAGLALGDKGISMLGGDGSGLKSLMVNTGEGIKALGDGLEGNVTNLLAFPGIAAAVTAGMVALTAGDLVSSMGNFMSSIFKEDGEDSIFVKIANDLQYLSSLGEVDTTAFDQLSDTLFKLGDGVRAIEDADMDDFKDNIMELGASMESIIPLMDKMYNGGKIGEGFFDGKEIDFGIGLKNVPLAEVAAAFEQIRKIAGEPIGASIVGSAAGSQATSEQLATAIRASENAGTQRTAEIAAGTDVSGGNNVVQINNNTNAPTVNNSSATVNQGSSAVPSPVRNNGGRVDAYAAA